MAVARPLPFLAIALALGGCGQQVGDARTARGTAWAPTPGDRLGDPALAAAINAPIMTDPGLGQMSNADAIRPAPEPDPVSVPPDGLGIAAGPAPPHRGP